MVVAEVQHPPHPRAPILPRIVIGQATPRVDRLGALNQRAHRPQPPARALHQHTTETVNNQTHIRNPHLHTNRHILRGPVGNIADGGVIQHNNSTIAVTIAVVDYSGSITAGVVALPGVAQHIAAAGGVLVGTVLADGAVRDGVV